MRATSYEIHDGPEQCQVCEGVFGDCEGSRCEGPGKGINVREGCDAHVHGDCEGASHDPSDEQVRYCADCTKAHSKEWLVAAPWL